MASQAGWVNVQKLESDLLWAADFLQNIILSLRTIDEDLSYLLEEIDRCRSKRLEIYEMRDICSGCILGGLEALAVADELRSKHEQLFDFFVSSPITTTKPYDLAFRTQALHEDLFSTILVIKMSLEDAELQFRSLQKARIFQSRLKKVVGCIRDLLTLAAPATAFIPYVGPLVGAVCGIGAGLAAVAHERIELEQAFQFSNLRAAVQQTLDTRNTLDDIMTCQTVLNNTTYQALLLMADYDDVQKMLAPERYTLIDHEDHMRY